MLVSSKSRSKRSDASLFVYVNHIVIILGWFATEAHKNICFRPQLPGICYDCLYFSFSGDWPGEIVASVLSFSIDNFICFELKIVTMAHFEPNN